MKCPYCGAEYSRQGDARCHCGAQSDGLAHDAGAGRIAVLPTKTDQSVTVKGINTLSIVVMAFIAAFACVLFGIAAYLERNVDDPIAWIIPTVMGLAIMVMASVAILRNSPVLRFTRDGMGIAVPLLDSTVWFTGTDIESATMRGRVLRISLNSAPSVMMRRQTFILLGDPVRREEVERWANRREGASDRPAPTVK